MQSHEALKATVYAEWQAFVAALPRLLEECPGRWVVFHGGEVQSIHDGIDEAYGHATRTLGPRAGFVVDRVAPVRPVHLSGGSMIAL